MGQETERQPGDDALEFRVLGALEVRRGGSIVPLGAPKLRTVLAVLVSGGGRKISVDTLVDSLWADTPPKSAVKNVQGYVSQLRHEVLGDPARIELDGSDYRLVVRHGELDAARFDELVREARACEEPARKAEHFRHALGLWRGTTAYQSVPENRPCDAEARRLEEMRLGVLLERADVLMRLGRAADLLPDLVAHTRDLPLNEELWARLIRALHVCGRPADALLAFEDARRALLAEGGLEPGPVLRSLRQEIAHGLRGPAAPRCESGRRRGAPRSTPLRGADEAQAWGTSVLAPMRLSPLGRRAFRGAVGSAEAGAVVVGRLRCSPHVVSRHARLMSSSDQELVKVVLNRSGTDMLVSQNGRERPLAPGGLTVCDMTRPYDIVVRDLCDVTFLGVPRPLLGPDAERVRDRAALPAPADAATAMIATCLADMSDRLDDLPGPRGRHLGDAVTAMLRAALAGTSVERVETPTDLADRILAYASAALHDTSLSEESVARSHGISARRLRRLFRDRELPLMEWVRRERLRRVRSDLRDPAYAHRSFASVAARWGLVDAVGAGRALRAEFGRSPDEIRRSADV